MVDEKTKAAPQTDAPDEWGDDRGVFLPTWRFDGPEANGNPFVGVVLSDRLVKGVAGLDGTERDVTLYTLAPEDSTEQFTLWGSGMLERILPEHIGHRVKITDNGLAPQAGGTSLRMFDVRCSTCTRTGK